MTKFGQREVQWSGATPEEHELLKDIITDYFAYRLSAFPKLKKLCEGAPDFAMAHILKGYLLTSMGTQGTVPAATKAADRAADCSCLLYTSPSPRDVEESRMPSSA